MKFCFSHCVHGKELFKTFNFADRVGLKKKIFTGIYKSDTAAEFCASVLSYCFKLIFEDIIENNCTFELPLVAKRHAEIYIQPIVGDELKNGLKAGKWRELDVWNSDFTAYDIVMTFDKKSERKTKKISLTSEMRKKLYDNINNGKKYF